MKKFYLPLFLILLAFPLFAEKASQDLKDKLDQKISYKSEGRSIENQLKEISIKYNIHFIVDEPAQEKLATTSKKFIYQNTRTKYIFYRLMKEAGLKYKYNGDSIVIYDNTHLLKG